MGRSEDNFIELVSLSDVRWALGIELGSLGLCSERFYPLGHRTSPFGIVTVCTRPAEVRGQG